MTAGVQIRDEPHPEVPVARSVRLPLVLMSFLLAQHVLAQRYAIDRGVWQPAGGLMFWHGKSDVAGEATSLSVDPGIGYFVLPGVLMRGGATFNYQNNSQGHSFTYGAGPGLAYYFRRGPHTLYPYIRGNVSFSWSRYYLRGSPDLAQRTRLNAWTVSAGVVRLLTSHFGLTGEAFYAHSSSTSERLVPIVSTTKYSISTVGLEFGVAFFVY